VKNLKVTLLSVWSWTMFGLVVIVWLPLMAVTRLVTAPFDKGRYWTGLLFRKMAVTHQRLTPMWHFRVVGEMPADPRNPYVVVANHESFVDILLIAHLPFDMKWLTKKELFKIPVVGWLLRLAGDVPLTRGERSSASTAMGQCEVWLDRKVSVMIFPEGTRSTTGEMGAFKDGAFRLAIDTQLPILPLAVHGAHGALRPHDWRMYPASAEVRVLEPVPTQGLTMADLDTLRERVRDRISAEVKLMRDDESPVGVSPG
jgi:1-acyl-sn-glycerol-3-phosphate acyltransferase